MTDKVAEKVMGAEMRISSAARTTTARTFDAIKKTVVTEALGEVEASDDAQLMTPALKMRLVANLVADKCLSVQPLITEGEE